MKIHVLLHAVCNNLIMPEPMHENDHISALIARGETFRALEASGQAWRLSGRVTQGNRIGRTLGYPTANLEASNSRLLTPAQGVYTAWVYLYPKTYSGQAAASGDGESGQERKAGGSWHEAMVNVGLRPTINADSLTIEAHLFDFSENIYGQRFSIHFLQRMRDEMRFSSLAELKNQLDSDQKQSRQALSALRPRLLPGEDMLRLAGS